MSTGLNFNRPLVEASIRAVAALARDPHALIRVDARKGAKLHSSMTSFASNPKPLVDFAHSFDGVDGVNLHMHLGDMEPNLADAQEVRPNHYRSLFGINVAGPNGVQGPAKFGASPFLVTENADGPEVAWDFGESRPVSVIDQIQGEMDREAGRNAGAKASATMRIPGTVHYPSGLKNGAKREPVLIGARVVPSETPEAA